MITEQKNSTSKMELEAYSRLSAHYPEFLKTFRVINPTPKDEFIFSQTRTRGLQNCGIVEGDTMEKIWGTVDTVFRYPFGKGEKTVGCLMENSDLVWSFLALVLEGEGYTKPYFGKEPHYCSGNWYYHCADNGMYLPTSVHQYFHRFAEALAEQGYDAFYSFLKKLGCYDLLDYYGNRYGEVLFKSEDDDQMQRDVILDFFGSVGCHDQCCKALLEKTHDQKEKERHFNITIYNNYIR